VIWDTDRTKVNSAFADRVDTIPGSWAVVQGFRSPTNQTAKWQEGRDAQGNIVDKAAVVTNAKGFQSPHTVTNPIGTTDGIPDADAIDLAWIDEHGNRTWNYKEPQWKAMWGFVDAAPGMHGGWHFPEPDQDHIQDPIWIQIRQQLKDSGKWNS
jgi:hypothetical protein